MNGDPRLIMRAKCSDEPALPETGVVTSAQQFGRQRTPHGNQLGSGVT
jgi:hypothetical protein